MGSARLPLHRDQETAFPEWLNRQQINASVTLLTNTSILPPRARAVGVPAQTYFPVLRTHHAATSIARGWQISNWRACDGGSAQGARHRLARRLRPLPEEDPGWVVEV